MYWLFANTEYVTANKNSYSDTFGDKIETDVRKTSEKKGKLDTYESCSFYHVFLLPSV